MLLKLSKIYVNSKLFFIKFIVLDILRSSINVQLK